MKKTYQSSAFLFIIFFSMITSFGNAQWLSKASGISTHERGLVELIAVSNSVVWGVAGPVINPPGAPINEFTRTTDGGNHWTAGNINAFPDFYLIGIAPLSATLCYGSIANFDNGNAKIVKTTDGGITRTEVEISGTCFTNDLAYVPGTASTYVSTGGHDFPGYAENGSLHGNGTQRS